MVFDFCNLVILFCYDKLGIARIPWRNLAIFYKNVFKQSCNYEYNGFNLKNYDYGK